MIPPGWFYLMAVPGQGKEKAGPGDAQPGLGAEESQIVASRHKDN